MVPWQRGTAFFGPAVFETPGEFASKLGVAIQIRRPFTLALLIRQTKGILLISAGSKLAIARIAKEACIKRGLALHIVDTQRDIPSRFVADQFAIIPFQEEGPWIENLLDYCSQHSIGLALPTRHSDLPVLARHARLFEERNIQLCLSGESTVNTCIDKIDTYRFLKSINAPTPETYERITIDQQSGAAGFPLFAKPGKGAAATAFRIVHAEKDLENVPEDWILQELAHGREFTVNLYLNAKGQTLCAIPHERLVVESGEVVQARTRRLPSLIDEAKRIASCLPEARGIINMQAFYDPQSDTMRFIEINPRIGGGYPLVDAAKGAYIEWLCQEYLDGKDLPIFENWTENLAMFRYREAFFEL